MVWGRERVLGTVTYLRAPGSLRTRLIVTMTLAVLALLLGTTGTLAMRHRVSGVQDELRTRLQPAQAAVQSLALAYDDEQTGQRGYTLTHDEAFLQPYREGQVHAAQMEDRLGRLLDGREVASATLAGVRRSGDAWSAHAAAQVSSVRSGRATSSADLKASETRGKTLFDDLRDRLTTLDAQIVGLTQVELEELGDAQAMADRTMLAAVLTAMCALLALVVVLRVMLAQPLGRLIAALSEVANDSYERPIPMTGPTEIRQIATAAEAMRTSIVEQTAALSAAEHSLGISNERDRLAAELRELTIERVFALGLRLSGLAARHPPLRAELHQLVDEADDVIRELRSIIFELGHDSRGLTVPDRLNRLLADGAPALGFAPVLELRGSLDRVPPDLANELLAVAREAVTNVARHARATTASVLVEGTATSLRLEVTDDGVGLPAELHPGDGIEDMRARAGRHKGEFTLQSLDGRGTVLIWAVPWTRTSGGSPTGGDPDR
jgi:signal transduction histidine kinase